MIDKMDECKWLTTSLFCEKKHWSKIISEVIPDFLNTSLNKEIHEIQIYLQFNYLGGENIRLAFFSNFENVNDSAKQLDAFFKNFLSKLLIPKNTHELPINGFFIPFPQNTIQYGLYSPIVNKNLEFVISQTIIDALFDEFVDDECILTLTLYLTLGTMKVAISSNVLTKDECSTFYRNEFLKKNDLNEIDYFELKFINSEVLISEIVNDIFDPSLNNSPKWLTNWMLAYNLKIDLAKDEKVINPTFFYTDTVALIYRHLGITERMRLILSYFLSEICKLESVN